MCILPVLGKMLLTDCRSFGWILYLWDAGDQRLSVFSPEIRAPLPLKSWVHSFRGLGSIFIGRNVPLADLWCNTFGLPDLSQMKMVEMEKQAPYMTACLEQTIIDIIKTFSAIFTHTILHVLSILIIFKSLIILIYFI